MPAAAEVRELSAAQFIAALDSLTWIYAHAMGAPAGELPGRLAIMQRHAGYPGFRAVVAIPAEGAPEGLREGLPEGLREGLPEGLREGLPGSAGSSLAARTTPAATAGPAGFAYGFHGSAGQWWYEVVRASLAAERGSGPASWWLGDCFEVAEVHVQPGHQGRGSGRAMMHRLAAGLTERTAVLSTPDGHTRAHRLYRSLGFGNLLPALSFPGASSSYAIMGAALPLPSTRPVADRSASPSRR